MLSFNRELWAHQKSFLINHAHKKEYALLWDCGVGKTTAAIGWLRTKYNEHKALIPTLIISPVATLDNWFNELKINSPEKVWGTAVIVRGSEKQRIEILKSNAKIFIINPESLDMKKFTSELRTKHFRALILDECHRFKNHKSKRFQALLSVSDFIENRLLLTGTPILNSYLDVWAQWRILDEGASLGLNFYVFREQYFRDKNIAWKGKSHYFPNYVPKIGIEEKLAELISLKSSRAEKEKCLDLPDLVRMTEYIELGTDQKKHYNEMKQELVTYIKSDACVATNALVQVLRLLQIVSGYVQGDSKHSLKDNPRLKRLSELLEDLTPRHKVIAWCVFKQNYEEIKALCDDLKIKYAELTGETKDRAKQIESFQDDPECRVMISNPRAGGIGINLTAASYAIYYSRSHSLGDRIQSEARNYRGGSEIHNKITLIDLVAKNTIDELVMETLARKEEFSENILDRLKDLD